MAHSAMTEMRRMRVQHIPAHEVIPGDEVGTGTRVTNVRRSRWSAIAYLSDGQAVWLDGLTILAVRRDTRHWCNCRPCRRTLGRWARGEIDSVAA
jgi:hypothetical protein